jgi:hypothetical protein
MILISHRGNINGKSSKENHPDHIKTALNAGYDVEVDVWYTFGKWSLGHDEPQYIIDKKLLQNPKIWCHAKNISTFYNLLNLKTICFFHNKDDATLTSNGYIWTYPGKILTNKSICVLPDWDANVKNCAGICSDRISRYK